jgi:hypothetical protein
VTRARRTASQAVLGRAQHTATQEISDGPMRLSGSLCAHSASRRQGLTLESPEIQITHESMRCGEEARLRRAQCIEVRALRDATGMPQCEFGCSRIRRRCAAITGYPTRARREACACQGARLLTATCAPTANRKSISRKRAADRVRRLLVQDRRRACSSELRRASDARVVGGSRRTANRDCSTPVDCLARWLSGATSRPLEHLARRRTRTRREARVDSARRHCPLRRKGPRGRERGRNLHERRRPLLHRRGIRQIP